MDDVRYTRYLTWRNEALRRCRSAVEPPVASRLPATIDVAAIRHRLGHEFCGRALSQDDFARRFGFSPAAVRDWEQGRRAPNALARVLLLTIASDPAAVDAALLAAMEGVADGVPDEILEQPAADGSMTTVATAAE